MKHQTTEAKPGKAAVLSVLVQHSIR